MRLQADDGALYAQSTTHFINLTDNNGITFGGNPRSGYQPGNNFWSIRPASNDTYTLGTSANKWSDIYSTTSSINTSDRTEKKNIEYDLSVYEKFFLTLKPTQYKFINNKSDRYHVGFISQDVEESIYESGLTSLDFAGFIKHPKNEDDTDDSSGFEYGLRYGEFIALNTHMIQKLYKKIDMLEDEITKLKEKQI